MIVQWTMQLLEAVVERARRLGLPRGKHGNNG